MLSCIAGDGRPYIAAEHVARDLPWVQQPHQSVKGAASLVAAACSTRTVANRAARGAVPQSPVAGINPSFASSALCSGMQMDSRQDSGGVDPRNGELRVWPAQLSPRTSGAIHQAGRVAC